MVFGKATSQDVEQLVKLKVAYLYEEYVNQNEKELMNMLLEDATIMGLCVVELKATEQGYSLYKSIGFADSVSKYHQMEWRNESAEKNTLQQLIQ